MSTRRLKMSPKPKGPVVFFDFDNTITTYDVLDDIISTFSINGEWKKFEDKWKKGKIGSRECLEGQLKGIRITKKALDNYFFKVTLDPYFKRLLKLLDSHKIKIFILSDNFDYILKGILKNSGIKGRIIYSNRLTFKKDRLIPSFPLANSSCGRCGHCKKTSLLANVDKPGSLIYYIGDGLSDICAARASDIVFAKASLEEYFKSKRLTFLRFGGLKDVHGYFRDIFKSG